MNDTFKIRSFTFSFTGRLFLIGFLAVILFITLIPIAGLIDERQDRYDSAQKEVSGKWGNKQIIAGPVLSVAYKDPSLKDIVAEQRIIILPENLSASADVTPEVRSRGIFDVLLYTAKIKMKGVLPAIDTTSALILPEGIKWKNNEIMFDISDIRGITDEIDLKINGQSVALRPSAQNVLQGYSFSALSPALSPNQPLSFELSLTLRGSESLSFVPVGRKTSLTMTSSWPDPSFTGDVLPAERELRDNGFKASWDVSSFRRTFPDYWFFDVANPKIFNLSDSAFGANFIVPTDFYQKTMRSVKYGVLFIVFTFLVFFLFEVKSRLRVHPFQYLLVGFALGIFYLLLLSLAEHIGFTPAYIVASAATVSLISVYSAKALNQKKRGIITGIVLAFLYGYLYFLLNESDYALLVGSISLFAALAFVMYFTRNIQWYQTGKEGDN